MNVLHVVPAIARRYGGPSVAAIEMCRALEVAGLRATLACTDADGAERLPLPLGVVAPYDGVNVIAFRRVASESFKFSPSLAAWMRAHVRDFNVVHIHAVMSHACVAAARACREAGVPYVLRTIGTLDRWSIEQKAAKKRVFMSVWGRAMLSGAAAVHVTSPEERRTLVETWGVSRVALIPIGIAAVGPDPSATRSSDAAPYVLTMSRLHPVKGLELLIDGFARTAASPALSTWRLKIAGDGDAAYVAELRERAARSAAADRIEFLGWADGEAKRALLAGAALVAMTSHHENFGLALVEAMAHGVPGLVCPGVQIASWITERHAGWVAEPTATAIAAGLQTAMSDAHERGRRGAAAAALASEWRWPGIADQLTDLYQRIAGPSRAADVLGPSARTMGRAS